MLLVFAMKLLGARGDGPDSVSARQPGDSRVGSAEDHRHCAGPLMKMTSGLFVIIIVLQL